MHFRVLLPYQYFEPCANDIRFSCLVNTDFILRYRPRGMLDPQPTPWSPPAPSELSDTLRHEISSGKYKL